MTDSKLKLRLGIKIGIKSTLDLAAFKTVPFMVLNIETNLMTFCYSIYEWMNYCMKEWTFSACDIYIVWFAKNGNKESS